MTEASRQQALGQFPTPAWAAAALVRSHLPDLDRQDFVVEPSCGPGRFLQAIPGHIPVLGVELDTELAEQARLLTGRPVIAGDFLEVELPETPTVIVGNPPFKTALIEAFLERAHDLLVNEGRVCFVLPAFFLQTARRVMRYSEQWSMAQEMLPRNLYDGLKHPLCFTTFRKDRRRLMVGFGLFAELAYLQGLSRDVQQAMREGPATWGALVTEALEAMGGEASLRAIYEYAAERRPTPNPAWREQIRKVCQAKARRTGRGRYALQDRCRNLALDLAS